MHRLARHRHRGVTVGRIRHSKGGGAPGVKPRGRFSDAAARDCAALKSRFPKTARRGKTNCPQSICLACSGPDRPAAHGATTRRRGGFSPRASGAPLVDGGTVEMIRSVAASKTLLVGVIGHVDHGKTALVRALTGIETDRLKEERARGVSIVPGFALLTSEQGRSTSWTCPATSGSSAP
ncbi:hypothetical protein ACU4GA_04080 [Methylobacterium oryzae CBMB20]